MMPLWLQLLVAVCAPAGLGAGVIAWVNTRQKAKIAAEQMRLEVESQRSQREADQINKVWKVMGTYESRIKHLEEEIASLHKSRQELIGHLHAAHMEIILLKTEVNEFCKLAGREPKYPATSFVHPAILTPRIADVAAAALSGQTIAEPQKGIRT